MKMKRIIAWGVGFVVIVAIGLHAEFIRESRDKEPIDLLACMEADVNWVAWTCKQVLIHDNLRPEQVERLNHEGGAMYPVKMFKDTETAEQMLALFIARGVNINAGDERTRGWTALYIPAIEGDIERAKLLIKYGARVDIRDKEGMTPLDFAIRMQKKYPLEPKRTEMVKLLEAESKMQG